LISSCGFGTEDMKSSLVLFSSWFGCVGLTELKVRKREDTKQFFKQADGRWSHNSDLDTLISIQKLSSESNHRLDAGANTSLSTVGWTWNRGADLDLEPSIPAMRTTFWRTRGPCSHSFICSIQIVRIPSMLILLQFIKQKLNRWINF
jgi:hypothetical protein